MDPHKIPFRNLKREIVYLPLGRTIEPRTSSYGICILNGRILLSLSAFNDLWEVPGGKSDPSEELLETMRREFTEETGYQVPDQEFILIGSHREYFYVDSTDNYCDSTMSFYRFHKLGPQITKELDSHEVKGISWFDKESLQHIKIHPISKQFITQVLGAYENN